MARPCHLGSGHPLHRHDALPALARDENPCQGGYPRSVLVRRMLLLIAVLMAITAVTVAVAPRRPLPRDTTTAVPATPTPAPAPVGSPRAQDDDELADAPLRTMDARRRDQLFRVPVGERVRLRVVSPGLE